MLRHHKRFSPLYTGQVTGVLWDRTSLRQDNGVSFSHTQKFFTEHWCQVPAVFWWSMPHEQGWHGLLWESGICHYPTQLCSQWERRDCLRKVPSLHLFTQRHKALTFIISVTEIQVFPAYLVPNGTLFMMLKINFHRIRNLFPELTLMIKRLEILDLHYVRKASQNKPLFSHCQYTSFIL